MSGIRPSGLHVNKPALFGLFLLVLIVFIGYKTTLGSGTVFGYSISGVDTQTKTGGLSDSNPSKMSSKDSQSILDGSDYKLPSLEPLPEHKTSTVPVVVGDKTVNVFVQQAIPKGQPKLDILLLHGMAFSSQNWVDIKTIYYLAQAGYRVIAIDLPGRKQTKEAIDHSQFGPFVGKLIEALKMSPPVIVSPSASGRNSIPYIFSDPKTASDRAKAFVPVAPSIAGNSEYRNVFPNANIPTLIVYGTKDVKARESTDNLKLIPGSLEAPIQDASHACYMDKPDDFHKVLLTFLDRLK